MKKVFFVLALVMAYGISVATTGTCDDDKKKAKVTAVALADEAKAEKADGCSGVKATTTAATADSNSDVKVTTVAAKTDGCSGAKATTVAAKADGCSGAKAVKVAAKADGCSDNKATKTVMAEAAPQE